MSNQKVYKKGEVLFKEGDKIQNIIYIQSGGVSQCLIRGKKNIDLFQLGANQVLGEICLLGQPTHFTSAIATAETKTLEVPIDIFKAQYDTLPQAMRLFNKSLIERLKATTTEAKSNRLEKDSSPCPEDQVAKIFGAMFFSANHKGEKQKDASVEVDWNIMKNYAQRIMGESPKRLEQAINVLIKLKLAKFTMGKLPEDPDGPDVIQQVTFFNLPIVEAFFEFYQYYYYKPGKGDILKYEESQANLLELFIKLTETETPDRFGVVGIEYNKLVEEAKAQLGINLNNDHFGRLEQKGVMCKRRNLDKAGVRVEFEIKEFKNIFFSWKILREIDKWNEKGFVDLDEKEEKKVKKDGPTCPQCSAPTTPQQKFCGECGGKLTPAAA